ncbi:MAG: ribulose-phosphate 3-epimerase [Raoultibacter sp.]
MFQPVRIAPSILSADFMHMEESIRSIKEGGAEFIHIDVMDGHFVPNLTIGVPFVKQLRAITKLPLDVHLMISNPLEQIPWFIDAGADIVNFHVEPYEDDRAKTEQALQLIKDAGLLAALTIKPATPVSSLEPFMSELDMVLVMSVNPGFSGQSYIEGSENKVAEVVRIAREKNLAPLIEVDGGIGLETASRVVSAGADVLVAGNAVFGASDIGAAIAQIKQVSNDAQRTA